MSSLAAILGKLAWTSLKLRMIEDKTCHICSQLEHVLLSHVHIIIINPILIRVYPSKRGWPDLPQLDENDITQTYKCSSEAQLHSHEFKPCSSHGLFRLSSQLLNMLLLNSKLRWSPTFTYNHSHVTHLILLLIVHYNSPTKMLDMKKFNPLTCKLA